MSDTDSQTPKILAIPIGPDATGMCREFDSLGNVEVPHVDVVVWVDGLLRAQRPADQLDAAVGNHLVDVHVRLGA